MTSNLEGFFRRKAVSFEAVHNNHLKAPSFVPLMDTVVIQEEIRDFALAPWNFENLPGTNQAQWPEGLKLLNEKLLGLEPLALWAEPLELKSDAKQFYQDIRNLVNS